MIATAHLVVLSEAKDLRIQRRVAAMQGPSLRCARSGRQEGSVSAVSASALVIRTGRWDQSARFVRAIRRERARTTRVHIFSYYFNTSPSTNSGSENDPPRDRQPVLERHAEPGEVRADVLVDLLRCLDVRLPARRVAAPELGDAAAVERAGMVGVGLQGEVVLGERLGPVVHLQVHEAARIARVKIVGRERQRLVAVGQRLLQLLADDGAGQAAVVVGRRQVRAEADGLAVVGGRLLVAALAEAREAAIVEERRILGLQLDGGGVILDRAVEIAEADIDAGAADEAFRI